MAMPSDVFTEPVPDTNTLGRLGPLRALAGIWTGTGIDTHPSATGPEDNQYVERIELRIPRSIRASLPAPCDGG